MINIQKIQNPTIRQFCLVILIVYGINLQAQVKESSLKISGNLKLQVGLEIITPEEATLKINPIHTVVLSDSLGDFSFDNLKPGKYNLKVVGFGYQTLDTLITLENESIQNLNLLIITDCEVNGEIAVRDIKKRKPKLF